MSDREALDQALDILYEPDFDDFGQNTTPVRYPLDLIGAAAQTLLAQLPEKCGTCDGTGWEDKGELLAKVEAAHTGKRVAVAGAECLTCHGTGKVYSPQLVARIAEALRQVTLGNINQSLTEDRFPRIAVAVLDVLNGETP